MACVKPRRRGRCESFLGVSRFQRLPAKAATVYRPERLRLKLPSGDFTWDPPSS